MNNRRLVIIGLLSIISGILISLGFNSSRSSSENQYYFNEVDEDGDYLRIIYIGSSNCVYCNTELNEKIKSIKSRIEDESIGAYDFVFTGIAVDNNSQNRFEFLNKSGFYHEIISGGGWANLGAMKYIWREFEHTPVIPQLIITHSIINVREINFGIEDINREEEIIFRFDNYFDILNLSEDDLITEIKSALHLNQ